jgi:hypothetical protein
MVIPQKFTLIAAIALGLQGCGFSSDTESSKSALNQTNSTTNIPTRQRLVATLSWRPPTENVDGSPLILSELVGYKLYFGTSPTTMNNVIEIDSSSNMDTYSAEFESLGLETGNTYYFAMSSISDLGIESQISEIATFSPN